MVPYYLIGKEPFFMKRITEAQIRQVIREEILGLLNEIQAYERYPEMAPESIRNKGEYLGNITVEQLINVLELLPDPHTLNQFEFLQLKYDKKTKAMLQSKVYIFKSNVGDYYSFAYYDGDGYVDLTLSPKNVTGPASGRFETKPNDYIFKAVQRVYPDKIRMPYSTISQSTDTSGTFAGLPKDLPKPKKQA